MREPPHAGLPEGVKARLHRAQLRRYGKRSERCVADRLRGYMPRSPGGSISAPDFRRLAPAPARGAAWRCCGIAAIVRGRHVLQQPLHAYQTRAPSSHHGTTCRSCFTAGRRTMRVTVRRRGIVRRKILTAVMRAVEADPRGSHHQWAWTPTQLLGLTRAVPGEPGERWRGRHSRAEVRTAEEQQLRADR